MPLRYPYRRPYICNGIKPGSLGSLPCEGSRRRLAVDGSGLGRAPDSDRGAPRFADPRDQLNERVSSQVRRTRRHSDYLILA